MRSTNRREAAEGFTLTELLLAMCVVSPIAIAIAIGQQARHGVLDYVVRFFVGAVAGGVGAWAMYSAVGGLVRRVPEAINDRWWYSGLVLLGMLAWIVVVDIASGLVSSSLLRLT